jgi:hypothetical protein
MARLGDVALLERPADDRSLKRIDAYQIMEHSADGAAFKLDPARLVTEHSTTSDHTVRAFDSDLLEIARKVAATRIAAKILTVDFRSSLSSGGPVPLPERVNHISSLAPGQVLRSATQTGILFEYEATENLRRR